MQAPTPFPRTEVLQIKVNPHLKEKIEYKYRDTGLTLEDMIHNFMQEECEDQPLTPDQCDRLFNHPDMIEAIAEMEAKSKDPNRKGWNNVAEMHAAILAEDDDE